MCGLSGFVDFTQKSSLEVLTQCTDVLHHRGPDDSGYYYKELQDSQVGLGHRRLSIQDLSKHGHQPMCFDGLVMVFNGEVYNFNEIRTELKRKGYVFESLGDTEVLLKAYHCWGTEALHQFNGMFSLVIYHERTHKLLLVRDRAGVKPLYWYKKNGLFLFASELKSFHQHPGFDKKLCANALALYLKYGYIPQPTCIFESAHKLQAGHYLELDLTKQEVTEKQYWNVIDYYSLPKLDISEQEAIEETERLLKSACEYRMVSDVPVGIFLSGGYDSSTVTAILQSNRTERLKTFSIGFREEKYNEADYAKQVAKYLGTDHTEYYCTQKDALDILPLLPEIWDEPFGDSSAIPTVLVSKLAKKNVTVSLSADGGDEIFAGYSKYTGITKKHRAFSALPSFSKPWFRGMLTQPLVSKAAEKVGMFNAEDRMSRFALMLNSNEQELLEISSNTFTPPEITQLLKAHHKKLETNFDCFLENDWLSNVLAVDYSTYLVDDILTKVDRATMSVGLEGREPLLDYRIIEYVARLPNKYKIYKGNKKYLIKQIAHRYLPHELMDRPKMGFGVPIFDWLKDELRDYLMYYLDRDRLDQAGIFYADKVVRMRDRYLAGDQTNIQKLWFLLMFEMWRDTWCNSVITK